MYLQSCVDFLKYWESHLLPRIDFECEIGLFLPESKCIKLRSSAPAVVVEGSFTHKYMACIDVLSSFKGLQLTSTTKI